MLFLSSFSQYLFRVLNVKNLLFIIRDKGVFIETNNQLGEKTSLPQLRTELKPENVGFKWRYHSVVP